MPACCHKTLATRQQNAFNQNRIRELESALSAAIHKIKKGELELNNWQNKWKDADRMAQDLSHDLQSMKGLKNDDKEMIVALNAKLTAASSLQHKLEIEMENSKQEHEIMKQTLIKRQSAPKTSN